MQRKVALIAGGSRGIGAATARLLASQEVSVVIIYLNNSSAAETVVEQIKGQGGQARALQADIRDQQAVQRAVETTLHTYERIDILVHSASAGSAIKPFAQMSWNEFHQGITNELQGVFTSTRAVLPVMQQQRYGRIVYLGSGLSKSPSMYGGISIATAKAGLVGFARYIAKEYGPFGITANVVAPSLVATELSARMTDEQRATIAAMTPVGRIAQPEDIARTIAFFASDASGFMTGTYAPVNGGIAME